MFHCLQKHTDHKPSSHALANASADSRQIFGWCLVIWCNCESDMGRVVIQRVKQASVSVDGNVVSRIGVGLMVLVGIGADDSEMDLDYLVRKLVDVCVSRYHVSNVSCTEC
jgi:hypothetical protein